MENLNERAARNLERVREASPLVHNITNYVVMNYTANALLALGASPVMAHAENEVAEMAALAGAVVLNIGTLSDPWIEAMVVAGRRASELGKPVILDPVGAGATRLRTDAARRILAETDVRVVRGNASEILSLGGGDGGTKGVDAIHSVDDARDAARSLSRELSATLAITGPVDLVTDGDRTLQVANGHPLMGRITGSGCTATALVGAFCTVDEDPVVAAATALAFFGLAGQAAAEKTDGPGSFSIALLDALHHLTPEALRQGCRIETD